MSMDDANTLRNRGDVGPIFDARELGPIETAPRVRESALVAQTKHKKQLTRAEHAKTLRESKRAAFEAKREQARLNLFSCAKASSSKESQRGQLGQQLRQFSEVSGHLQKLRANFD